MPLKEGKTNKIIQENIRTLHHEGVPHKEAVARALQAAGRGLKNSKGRTK
jgi:hypothetical protein